MISHEGPPHDQVHPSSFLHFYKVIHVDFFVVLHDCRIIVHM